MTNYKIFIKKLEEIWKERNGEYQKLVFEKDRLQDAYFSSQRSTMSDVDRENEKRKYSDSIASIHAKMAEIKEETAAEIEKVQTEFFKAVDSNYSLKASAIDQDTATLLKAGISLTAGEITGLLRRFEDNQTMIRLIDSYCARNGLKSGEIAHVLNKQRTAELDKAAFDSLVQKVLWSASSDVSSVVWSPSAQSAQDAITETNAALGVSE